MAPVSSQVASWETSLIQDVADSESDPLPHSNNVAPQPMDAWAKIHSVDYPRSPLYEPNRSSPLHHNELTSQSPASTSSTSSSSPFIIRHFTDSEDETEEQLATKALVQRLTTIIDVTAEVAAEFVDENEKQGQELTEPHLEQVRYSEPLVYEYLTGCRRTMTTPEEAEEARRIRENPPAVTWEHLMGPFGYEQHQQNYHQRSQTEQHQAPQERENRDDWDIVQRIERDGKIDMEEAKYRVGMKGFLRLNA